MQYLTLLCFVFFSFVCAVISLSLILLFFSCLFDLRSSEPSKIVLMCLVLVVSLIFYLAERWTETKAERAKVRKHETPFWWMQRAPFVTCMSFFIYGCRHLVFAIWAWVCFKVSMQRVSLCNFSDCIFFVVFSLSATFSTYLFLQFIAIHLSLFECAFFFILFHFTDSFLHYSHKCTKRSANKASRSSALYWFVCPTNESK